MKLSVGFLMLTFLASAAIPVAAQDPRVHQLELDIAQLRRELSAQARRIDQLERQLTQGAQRPSVESTVQAPTAATASPAWLVAANWERIRPGMLEIDVVQLLGAPTSIRADSDAEKKTLFYALEVAPAAFLAGSIEVANGRVTEVKKPALR